MNGIKRNRNGFSLMEVMVSIALIGILFTPMLAFFSHSTQMNLKVKNIQRANTAAQAVMEEFRSYERIEDMVNTYWSTSTDGNVYENNDYTGTFDHIYENGHFIPNEKFYFQKNGIISDGKEYVARIDVDAQKYHALNNIEMPVISSLGSETTVVAKEQDETTDKIREFKQLHFNKTGVNRNEDYFAERLLKTMKVVIKDTDDTGAEISNGMVYVRVYSEYTLTENVDGCENAQVGDDIYNGLMEEERMKGIYVFFNFDITSRSSGRKISQKMEVNIDYQHPPQNWQCDYTVYAVCQGIHVMDTDEMIKDDTPEKKMTTYATMNNLSMNFASVSNMSSKAKVWTNYLPDNASVCSQSEMKDIVGTERINRLSELTVKIYNKDDLSTPLVTMTSTRGE